MNYYVTGDKHGDFNRILNNDIVQDPNNAIIILGDAGLNFWLNKTDIKLKQKINDNSKCMWYILHGNHSARPQDIKDMNTMFDENIHGSVYYESKYYSIRYFMDYGFYDINGYTCLVIGGAYSVDKYCRLQRAGLTEKENNPKKTGWFSNEQLSLGEMEHCAGLIKKFNATNKTVDFVMTHTCPLEWQPTDLFLGAVDQSTVDNSMEIWMNEIKNKFKWDIWLFGHYHADRFERPHVEQYYNAIESLDDIKARWDKYDERGALDWWLNKSPNFYMS